MVEIPLGKTTYRRRNARTPEISLVNCLVEADPTNQVTGFNISQRPALTSFGTVGGGPSRGVFRRAGSLDSLFYVVSGTELYSTTPLGNTTLLGQIAGSDMVIMDASATRLIIVADNIAYSWNGTALSQITMPDSRPVSSVTFINGYFLLTQALSQRVYWIEPGQTNPDPLSFFSAENAPDNLVRGIRLLDEYWAFGEQTTEVFQNTGNADAPFTPIGGRLYEKGCANKNTIAPTDNTLFWVGNDFIAYRADTTPQRISDHSIEERIKAAGAADLVAWAFAVEGHTLFSLRIGNEGTFCFDVENPGSWPRFKSWGEETWRAICGAQIAGDLIVAGDDSTGELWMLDSEASVDGGDPFEREVTGGLPNLGPPIKCSNVTLYNAASWAPITGDSSNPKIAMRYSDDGGNLFSSWLEEEIGVQGNYSGRTTWWGLGIIVTPGRVFHWRMTDDARFRASYATMNDTVMT